MHICFVTDDALFFTNGGNKKHGDGNSLRNWLTTSVQIAGDRCEKRPYQHKVSNSSAFAFATSGHLSLPRLRTAGQPLLSRSFCTDGKKAPVCCWRAVPGRY